MSSSRIIFSATLGIAICGCQGTETPPAESLATASPKPIAVGVPVTSLPTDIGLVVRRGLPITVGFSPDAAFRLFRDPKQSGFEFDDLPPKFQWPYKARTWEEAHMGFGEILYNSQLVAAMYQEDNGDQERVNQLLVAHRDQINGRAPEQIGGKRVNYWFWEKDGQRLMICAYPTGRDVIKITVAMGDNVVMDALGISPDKARKDLNQVDLFQAKKTPNSISITAPHG